MSRLKTILFLACCFLLGSGITKAILWYRAEHVATPRTGVGNAPPLHGFSLPLNVAAAGEFKNFPPLHATAVALAYPATRNPSVALADAVGRAHKLGLQVLLMPPATFSATNPYPGPLETIAAQAQGASVDVLCISWLNIDPDPKYWEREVAGVRKVYHGRVLFAATPEILPAIESFEAFDCIGVVGPIQLPRRLPHAADDVDLHALRIAWASMLDSLESLASKSDKSLVLLNMSVPPVTAAKLAVPGTRATAPTPDLNLQLMTYEALLIETKGRTATEGLFLPWSTPGGGNADAAAANRQPALLPKIESLWSPTSPIPPAATPPAPIDTEPDTMDLDPPLMLPGPAIIGRVAGSGLRCGAGD